jgi:serine protease AprX
MTPPLEPRAVRRKAVWGPKRILTALAIVPVVLLVSTPDLLAAGRNNRSNNNQTPAAGRQHFRQAPKARPAEPSRRVRQYKLDDEVASRKRWSPLGRSRVIITLVPGARIPADLRQYIRRGVGKLDIINGEVLDLPNHVIQRLEARPEIFRVHHDRPIELLNYRTSVTVGAIAARQSLGYKGRGVGVAVIDSGISNWHDDLTKGNVSTSFPYGNQRVAKFVDFVNGASQPYDDNGHGSHVSGVIAGNGYDSQSGTKAGIAPEASIISLKVLDRNGVGTISNIIAALNWVAVNHQTYNIRVVNLSVGARIRESYWTDPLTLATKALVDRGIVVVGASGNFGKNALGHVQYGGITAPSNAPWVLTVGASSTQGTFTRNDDVMAGFSSNGPTNIDFAAKPDLVAPGTGSVSLSVPGSLFYETKVSSLVSGRSSIGGTPYLTLSGTSMAAPVVTGTVALMFQANPNLTPNLVKAILQYTAQQYEGYNALRQGAGFLNTFGAVKLSKFYANNRAGERMPIQGVWSQQILWGNHRITGGYLNPRGNAWSSGTIWGAAKGLSADNIVWGTECGDGCDNIVWGTHDANGDNIVWGTDGDDNIVWGTEGDDNIVWGTSIDGDNIVWGTNDDDNIVWGTDCGGSDCDNIVWGTADEDNIVWGTADDADNIVWGTNLDDNIVWGTSGDDRDNVEFPDAEGEPLPDATIEFGEVEPVTEGGI